jgi:acylphosphatase
MSKIRRRVLISGRVQGVNFRYYTRAAARDAGVYGWVRNLPDGRVEAAFEGDSKNVESMVAWCRRGSPHGRVHDVQVHSEDYQGEFTDFDVRYDGPFSW